MKQKFLFGLIAFWGLAITSCSNQQKAAPAQSDEEAIVEVDEDYVDVPDVQDAEDEPFSIEAVDLGLSVLWANANIGAYSIYDAGDYFAWGESSSKSTYMLDNYFDYYIEVKEGGFVYRGYKTFSKAGQTLNETEYDTASKILGDGWRMPTQEEYNELGKYCDAKVDYRRDKNDNPLRDENGKLLPKHVQITAPNGNIIFFPCGGYKETNSHVEDDNFHCWTTNIYNLNDVSKAMSALLNRRNRVGVTYTNRAYGLNIRAVKDRDASNVHIEDGVYLFEGIMGQTKTIKFTMTIKDKQVKGSYGLASGYNMGFIDFEGSIDDNNNIICNKTYKGEPYGRMEGVFDGISYRGKDYYDDEEDKHPFKLLVVSDNN